MFFADKRPNFMFMSTMFFACLALCLNKFLILKALIDIFNKERPYCGVCLQL